jgi:hypothetical protein
MKFNGVFLYFDSESEFQNGASFKWSVYTRERSIRYFCRGASSRICVTGCKSMAANKEVADAFVKCLRDAFPGEEIGDAGDTVDMITCSMQLFNSDPDMKLTKDEMKQLEILLKRQKNVETVKYVCHTKSPKVTATLHRNGVTSNACIHATGYVTLTVGKENASFENMQGAQDNFVGVMSRALGGATIQYHA